MKHMGGDTSNMKFLSVYLKKIPSFAKNILNIDLSWNNLWE